MGPVRLITVTEEAAAAVRSSASGSTSNGNDRWISLIHETLIRTRGLDDKGKSQPYWPTLWNYIEDNLDRAVRCARLQLQAREWGNSKGLA
jgi:hypothetical protein